MSKSMCITEEIIFKTTKSSIWNLVTNPEMTKQYMFGCEVLSDWKIGSPIVWKGKTEKGEEIIYVKGTIVDYINEEKVTFTMFDPSIGIADIPENYVNLTYEVKEIEDGCLLRIIQGDFNGTENGEKRFEESKQGWKRVIPLMKKIV